MSLGAQTTYIRLSSTLHRGEPAGSSGLEPFTQENAFINKVCAAPRAVFSVVMVQKPMSTSAGIARPSPNSAKTCWQSTRVISLTNYQQRRDTVAWWSTKPRATTTSQRWQLKSRTWKQRSLWINSPRRKCLLTQRVTHTLQEMVQLLTVKEACACGTQGAGFSTKKATHVTLRWALEGCVQTAQRAEVRAALRWVLWALCKQVYIVDSDYVHKGLQSIIDGRPLKFRSHRDLWRRIEQTMSDKGLQNFRTKRLLATNPLRPSGERQQPRKG